MYWDGPVAADSDCLSPLLGDTGGATGDKQEQTDVLPHLTGSPVYKQTFSGRKHVCPDRRHLTEPFLNRGEGSDPGVSCLQHRVLTPAVLGLRGVMGCIWTEADKGPASRSFRRVGAADGKSKCILSEMG